MKIKLSHAADFKRLLEALVDELLEAREHFHLHQELSASIEDNQDVFNLSVSFWNLTLTAHIDATLMRLCKAYDLYKGQPSLNLRNFLETINANMRLFDEPNFRERLKDNPFVDSLATDLRKPGERLDKDLNFVRHAPAVKKLTIWRNNYVAHRSRKTALALAEFTRENPLTFAEIEELIDKGLEIMNHYSSLYNASHHIAWESKDYKHVLDAVRGHLERREARIQQEIEAVNALARKA